MAATKQLVRCEPKARQAIRHSLAEMKRAQETPDEEWGGHKGIFLANQEGFLGGFAGPLLNYIEQLEEAADKLAHCLRESDLAEDQLLAREYFEARGLCLVCCGPLEGAPGPECAEDGCPGRDEGEAS